MNLFYIEEHTSCSNYISNTQIGFKLLKLLKGQKTPNREEGDVLYNLIIFVIEGEIELSCNEYSNRKFIGGEFVFISPSTFISGNTLKNSKLITLHFDYSVTNLCDKRTLNQYAEHGVMIDYDFRGLPFRSPLNEYLGLLEIFLEAGVNCIHLHEIKLKELFIVFRTAYSREEIAELFYPILGDDMDFKTSVLTHFKMGRTAKQIAHEMALSEASFARRFKREFETSYYQWMLKQKAQYIRHELINPDTTIKNIMYELNFANYSHFNRFCKEHLGSSPTELITSLRFRDTIK